MLSQGFTENELREVVRKAFYKRLRKEQPELNRHQAKRMARAAERVAWVRRDPKVIENLRQMATTSVGILT